MHSHIITKDHAYPAAMTQLQSCCARTLCPGMCDQPIWPAEAGNILFVLLQELARLGGEASFLRRTEARLKSNLGFAEDRTNELQREVTILRQQVASYEASEHEAQVLEDVQRSVSRESSAGGNIAARMTGEPNTTSYHLLMEAAGQLTTLMHRHSLYMVWPVHL